MWFLKWDGKSDCLNEYLRNILTDAGLCVGLRRRTEKETGRHACRAWVYVGWCWQGDNQRIWGLIVSFNLIIIFSFLMWDNNELMRTYRFLSVYAYFVFVNIYRILSG